MPNTYVPALSGALPAWLPIASDAARTILHTVTRGLDRLCEEVERELVEHARCRRDVEALIERLITGLDEIDTGDEGREPDDDAEGSDGVLPYGDMDLPTGWWAAPLDERMRRPAYLDDDCEPSIGWSTGEAATSVPNQGPRIDAEEGHDGREQSPDEGAEGSAPESYGRGFGPCAGERARKERLFSEVTVGTLATYKRGQLADVVAFAREGRAGQ